MTTPVAVAAMAQGVLLAVWCGGRLGLILATGSILIMLAARRYFLARIGGINGDCLGATAHVIETFCLLTLTCRSCIS
jgi:cobalamin synthase